MLQTGLCMDGLVWMSRRRMSFVAGLSMKEEPCHVGRIPFLLYVFFEMKRLKLLFYVANT